MIDPAKNDPASKNIAYEIAITNWKRIRIFMVATLLFELLLIFLIDIPAINTSAPDELWLARSYLILHLIIGSTSLLGIILSTVFLKNDLDRKYSHHYLYAVLALIVLICISIIAGLDQITTGQISVFVINFLVAGVLFLVPFQISFFLFTIPFGIFIAMLFTYQPDLAIRNSHIVNGGIFWVAVLFLSRFMYDNYVSHIYKNIQLEEANQKLLVLSLYDPLTKLANRRNFELRITQELALVKRFNQLSWLILVDIDHFKNVNDRFGHAAGDQVLQKIAELLQANVRDVDLACRWGGEEFLLLITQTEKDDIVLLANRLCASLAQTPFDVDGKSIPVTASFGIARLALHGSEDGDFQACYRLADQALYRAKQNGRNQVVITD